jgi:hypothetical protein
MHKTYAMDTCIETNENRAFGTEVYSRYVPGICKDLEYVRDIHEICLTYDTIRIQDGRVKAADPTLATGPQLLTGADCLG